MSDDFGMSDEDMENAQIQMNHLAGMARSATASTRAIVLCAKKDPESARTLCLIGVNGEFKDRMTDTEIMTDIIMDLARSISSATDGKVKVKLVMEDGDEFDVPDTNIETHQITQALGDVPRT